MKSNMGAHLQVAHTKYVARSKKSTTSEEVLSSAVANHISDIGQLSVIKRKMRAVQRPLQESRIARVEELRAQVRAGTYKVDSMLLAQHLLANESHFMEVVGR